MVRRNLRMAKSGDIPCRDCAFFDPPRMQFGHKIRGRCRLVSYHPVVSEKRTCDEAELDAEKTTAQAH